MHQNHVNFSTGLAMGYPPLGRLIFLIELFPETLNILAGTGYAASVNTGYVAANDGLTTQIANGSTEQCRWWCVLSRGR
ncbi:hypothetical protein [Undibacterium sp. TS12]|uniref:hypothetical protein n=1 Tax=Undibacterium sp. TS12 TaxID=2908202 RepID=UPI001F4C5334|nr:hypothetical protein [Undibacterium sp. TS12]MCH8620413.1 hypothetical protein [Undibacterium sp. TS12]